MRIGYFDCFSGISGDMTLGALLGAGVEVERLKSELHKLNLPDWDLTVKTVVKQGIAANDVTFHVSDRSSDHPDSHSGPPPPHGGHTHAAGRSYGEIAAILRTSALEPRVLQDSLDVFQKIAEAEAKIHNTTPDEIHFHELGGLDALLDIVGAVIGLRLLGVEKVFCSPLPLSHGSVRCAHGTFPVPAPATMELLKGAHFRHVDIEGELVTPTGAGLLAHFAEGFLQPPEFSVQAIGWGAGKKDLSTPNVLRFVVGETSAAGEDLCLDRLQLLETNIDDMNPQFYERVMEQAFEMGALDVFLTPTQMKKNRPGIQLGVLCSTACMNELMRLLFRETTTLGVRVREIDRWSLRREEKAVETRYGEVRIKIGLLDGQPVNVSPEYEDCKRLAREQDRPMQEIVLEATEEARRAFLDKGVASR